MEAGGPVRRSAQKLDLDRHGQADLIVIQEAGQVLGLSRLAFAKGGNPDRRIDTNHARPVDVYGRGPQRDLAVSTSSETEPIIILTPSR